MPMTPGCQPARAAKAMGVARSPRSTSAIASASTVASISRRSAFQRSSVRALQRLRAAARLHPVLGGKKARATIGGAYATAGIDPGTEQESRMVGVDRLADARALGERREAAIAEAPHHLQPLGHQHAVDA